MSQSREFHMQTYNITNILALQNKIFLKTSKITNANNSAGNAGFQRIIASAVIGEIWNPQFRSCYISVDVTVLF